MPTPSPLCLVADGAGPFNPTFPNGLDIVQGDTVSIVLQSPAGVSNWYLQIGLVLGNPPVVVPNTGTDEQTSTPPPLTGVNGAGLVTGGPTATVTFTFPNAQGRTLLFSSTVTGTFGAVTTTFALFSRTAQGFRVGAAGMTREGSNSFGWASIVNPAIRNIGAASADAGAIHPRAQSTHGPGGAAYSAINPVGSVLTTAPAFLYGIIFDPLVFTEGRAPATTTCGPFVWGLSNAGVWRFDTSFGTLTVVPMDDIAEVASTSSSVVQDNSGAIWTIEATSNTLLQINQEPPRVVATYPIPNSSKNNLVYDPVNNVLILTTSDGTNKVSRFVISTKTFGPDSTIGTNPNELLQAASIAAGGFVFLSSYDTSGTNAWVYQINPLNLAVIGTFHLSVPTTTQIPQGLAFLANGGTPKLFLDTNASPQPPGGQFVYRIDVGTMTLDTSFQIPGSGVIQAMAFNPGDNSLWVTEAQVTPSRVYRLTNVTTGFTLANTFTPIDSTPGTSASTNSIVFDSVNNQFWVTCGNVDSINSVNSFGPSGTNTIASATTGVPPGTLGQILTSQGAGVQPQWRSQNTPGSDDGKSRRLGTPPGFNQSRQAAGQSGTLSDLIQFGPYFVSSVKLAGTLSNGAGGPGEYITALITESGGTTTNVVVLDPITLAKLVDNPLTSSSPGPTTMVYVGGSNVDPSLSSDFLICGDHASPGLNKLWVLDLQAGSSTTFAIPAPAGVTGLSNFSRVNGMQFDGHSLYVMCHGTFNSIAQDLLIRVDNPVTAPASTLVLNTTATFRDVVLDGKQIYALTTNGQILVANYNGSIPAFPGGTHVLGSGYGSGNMTSMCEDGRYLWVTDLGATSLLRIDKYTGQLLDTISVGGQPWYTRYDGRYVWVTNRTTQPPFFKIDPTQFPLGTEGPIMSSFNAFTNNVQGYTFLCWLESGGGDPAIFVGDFTGQLVWQLKEPTARLEPLTPASVSTESDITVFGGGSYTIGVGTIFEVGTRSSNATIFLPPLSLITGRQIIIRDLSRQAGKFPIIVITGSLLDTFDAGGGRRLVINDPGGSVKLSSASGTWSILEKYPTFSPGSDLGKSNKTGIRGAFRQTRLTTSEFTPSVNLTGLGGVTGPVDMFRARVNTTTAAGLDPGEYVGLLYNGTSGGSPFILIDPYSGETVFQFNLPINMRWGVYLGGPENSTSDHIIFLPGTGSTFTILNLTAGTTSTWTPATFTPKTVNSTPAANPFLFDGQSLWLIGHKTSNSHVGAFRIDNPWTVGQFENFVLDAGVISITTALDLALDGDRVYLLAAGTIYSAIVSANGASLIIPGETRNLSADFSDFLSTSSLCFDGEYLWVLGQNSGGFIQADRFDRDTGGIAGAWSSSIAVSPLQIRSDGNYVWVLTNTTGQPLFKIDPAGIQPGGVVQPIATVTGGAGNPQAWALLRTVRDGSAVYVGESNQNAIIVEDAGAYTVVGGLKIDGGLVDHVKPITQAGFPTPYVLLPTDRMLAIGTTTTAYSVTLPAAPAKGRQAAVVDDAGTAGTRNITLNGNGKNINGAATFVMSTNNQAVTIEYNGTQWDVIGNTSGGGAVAAPLPGFMSFTAGVFSAGTSTPTRTGAKFVDLTEFPASVGTFNRTVTFFADIETTVGTANVRLYNVTDGEVVTGTQLTTTNTTNTEVSVVVTVGSSAGNLKTGKSYEVDVWITGGGVSDRATCTNARLRFSYA